MKTNFYKQFLLTVIAALVAWNTFVKSPLGTVHAQNQSRYRVEDLKLKNGISSRTGKGLEQRPNESSRGELIQVLVLNDSLYAIYKDQ